MGILEALKGTGTLEDMEEQDRLDRVMGMRHAMFLIRRDWYESDVLVSEVLALLEGEL